MKTKLRNCLSNCLKAILGLFIIITTDTYSILLMGLIGVIITAVTVNYQYLKWNNR